MSRPLVRAFNCAVVVSVLLCAAFTLAWARSYAPEDLHVRAVDGQLLLIFSEGEATHWLGERFLDPGRNANPGSARRLLEETASGDIWRFERILVARRYKAENVAAPPAAPARRSRFAGVSFYDNPCPAFASASAFKMILIPLPEVIALAALLPASVLLYRASARARCRRRTRRGLCPGCGYDLRATPEGSGALVNRCPECGAAPKVDREKAPVR